MGMRALWILGLLAGCSEYNITRFDVVDTFFQNPPAEVDVLVVVDNSYSMEPYQQKLSTNFDEFVSIFLKANVDYQIGVVTTTTLESDHGELNGCTPAELAALPEAGHFVGDTFIRQDTPDGDLLFEELVTVGVCGTGLEMGLESALLTVVNNHPTNNLFFRDGASLSVVFVSDEEDGSPFGVATYVDELRSLVDGRDRRRFNASALVFDEGEGCSPQQTAGASRGARYMEAVEATGGIQGNICDEDYGDSITSIALAAARLSDTFYLSDEPSVSTLQVYVNEEEYLCGDEGWTFERVFHEGEEQPAIVFSLDNLPPAGASVMVQYVRGSGLVEDFCTAEPTATSSTTTTEEGA